MSPRISHQELTEGMSELHEDEKRVDGLTEKKQRDYLDEKRTFEARFDISDIDAKKSFPWDTEELVDERYRLMEEQLANVVHDYVQTFETANGYAYEGAHIHGTIQTGRGPLAVVLVEVAEDWADELRDGRREYGSQIFGAVNGAILGKDEGVLAELFFETLSMVDKRYLAEQSETTEPDIMAEPPTPLEIQAMSQPEALQALRDLLKRT